MCLKFSILLRLVSTFLPPSKQPLLDSTPLHPQELQTVPTAGARLCPGFLRARSKTPPPPACLSAGSRQQPFTASINSYMPTISNSIFIPETSLLRAFKLNEHWHFRLLVQQAIKVSLPKTSACTFPSPYIQSFSGVSPRSK